MSKQRFAARACALGLAATMSIMTAAASAAPLTGSGPNLAIPSPNPGEPPRVGRTLSNVVNPTSFDGSWAAPAMASWHGTFSAIGPVPSGNSSPAGVTRYDFTTLNAGLLPAGTFFYFGDVDGGSTTFETFVLSAYDASNALITTPWLDEPLGISGTGTGGGGSILPNNVPGWSWNGGTGQYTIDGTTVTGGNPNLAVWLESNLNMTYLTVERTSNFANFGLSAPIPEPATGVLFALAATAVGAGRMRRRV